MSESTERITHAFGRIIGGAIASMVVGGIIVILGIGLDWGGLVGGFAIGGGIGLVVVGAYFWGYANGLKRAATLASTSPASWLPSRDGR